MSQSGWFEILDELINFEKVIRIRRDYDAIQLVLHTVNETIYLQYEKHEDMIEDYVSLSVILPDEVEDDN